MIDYGYSPFHMTSYVKTVGDTARTISDSYRNVTSTSKSLVLGFETVEALERLGSSSGSIGSWWYPVDPKPIILRIYLKP
jgi:hypothetical protein